MDTSLYLMMNKNLAMTFPVLILEISFYTRAGLIFYYAMGITKRVSIRHHPHCPMHLRYLHIDAIWKGSPIFLALHFNNIESIYQSRVTTETTILYPLASKNINLNFISSESLFS